MLSECRPVHRASSCSETSYQRTLARFSTERAAQKYPAEYRNRRRDQRERRAILSSLRGVPRNSRVLDLPCGTGRLLRLLLDAGYRVTCADSSANMVSLAETRWREVLRVERGAASSEPRFQLQNVMQTEFGDKEFDAVICNRLFHHFAKSETRVQALKELHRIAAGMIVVSFFCSFALDSVRWHAKDGFRRLLGGEARQDRRPIPLKAFRDDIHRAGLQMVRAIPVFYGISPMWYVVAA